MDGGSDPTNPMNPMNPPFFFYHIAMGKIRARPLRVDLALAIYSFGNIDIPHDYTTTTTCELSPLTRRHKCFS